MLHIYDEIVASCRDPDPDESAVLLASIIRRARLDRRRFPTGIAWEEGREEVPITSRQHARRAAAGIAGSGEGETTHVCVMDRWGNVVSLTQSIERSFGAAVATPGLGFLHNGYMRTFKVKNRKHPHYLRPGGIARSNAAPTILLGPSGRRIAVGSTGSERMGSSIFQVLVRLRYQDPFTAVSAPRLHCTPEREVFLEADRFPPAALAALEEWGFKLTAWDPWSFKAGGLQLVTSDGLLIRGVAEPRRDGAAAGPRTEPRAWGPDA
jgi:gamma-glutamyltranspeptidase/glutathione hydrolase